MRTIRIALMLFLGAILGSMTMGTPAQAAGLHKFAKPSDPHEVAERVRASLLRDPMGRSAIDGPNCGRACATPEDYLEMIQQNPDLRDIGPKALGQLAAFYDKLQLIKHAPPGAYYMACKTGDGSASAMPKWNCMSRVFNPGEPCYAYQGRCVLARDCTNPVGRERQEAACVQLLVAMKPGDVLRGEPLAPRTARQMPVNSECPMMVQEPGSNEQRYPPADKCARIGCDFSRPADFYRMQLLEPKFSFKANVAGWAIIYLPREVVEWDAMIYLCIEPADGRKMAGKPMYKTAYHNGKAYVVYDAKQAPKEWMGTPHVWHLDTGSYN